MIGEPHPQTPAQAHWNRLRGLRWAWISPTYEDLESRQSKAFEIKHLEGGGRTPRSPGVRTVICPGSVHPFDSLVRPLYESA